MIDDANPIDDGSIEDRPSEDRTGDSRPTNNREIDDDHVADDDLTEALGDNSDLDIEALRAADAAIDAEDAAALSGANTAADLPPGLDEDVDEYADEFVAAMERQSANEAAANADDAEAPKFYESTADLHALDALALADRPSVLERLGPAHFRSKGFSFMGFLQTVYDHVATEVKPKGGATDGTTEAAESSEAPSASDTPLIP
ncbi:MAG: hypothetical protein JWM57_3391 [Phycisphaerales bacterium]|nr:hypothetical protein [Phycisphaerales bacterium]